MKIKSIIEVSEEELLMFLFSRFKKEELEARGLFAANTTVQHVGYSSDSNNLQFHLVSNTMETLLKLKNKIDEQEAKLKSMEAKTTPGQLVQLKATSSEIKR